MRPAGRHCARALPIGSLGKPEAASHSLALRRLAGLGVRGRLPPRCSTGCRRVRGGADVGSQDGGGGGGGGWCLLEALLPGNGSRQSPPAGEARGRGSGGAVPVPEAAWGGQAAERRREPGSRPRGRTCHLRAAPERPVTRPPALRHSRRVAAGRRLGKVSGKTEGREGMFKVTWQAPGCRKPASNPEVWTKGGLRWVGPGRPREARSHLQGGLIWVGEEGTQCPWPSRERRDGRSDPALGRCGPRSVEACRQDPVPESGFIPGCVAAPVPGR